MFYCDYCAIHDFRPFHLLSSKSMYDRCVVGFKNISSFWFLSSIVYSSSLFFGLLLNICDISDVLIHHQFYIGEGYFEVVVNDHN